jgi:endoglycosylceramidase
VRRLSIALLAGIALLALPTMALARGTAVPDALPHVVHPRSGAPYIADQAGRMLFLRGVAVTSLIQYSADFQETLPVARGDFAEMAALGFDVVRLPVSWSRLEPAPGLFSVSYLNRIDRVVRWAQNAGMYVWIDMHQDRYNRNTWPGQEVDGAPDWATLTDGAPCTPIGLSTLCAQTATESFWQNTAVDGRGLQQWYLGALVAVFDRLRADRRLLGIELMNEPTPGTIAPPAFERLQLWPFYRRMIAGLRAAGYRGMIIFEPDILRDELDRDPGLPQPFSDDPNLLYAPHIYTEVFSEPPQPVGAYGPLARSYAAAAAEARAYGAPWIDGEWGGGTDGEGGSWDRWLLENLELQDRYLAGGAFWMWKQRPGFYNWQTVEPDGGLRTDSLRAQLLSLPHPDAVPGTLQSIDYAGDRLRLRVSGPGGLARIWAGTVVRAGGPTLLADPLTRALIDGRPMRARIIRRRFRTASVWLSGDEIDVRIPPGTRQIVLMAPPRGERRKRR